MKFILVMLLTAIVGGIWGGLQPFIFPIDIFGPLCYFTSLFGGMFIGYIGFKIYQILED